MVEKTIATAEMKRAIEVIKDLWEGKTILKISDIRKKERVIETAPSQISPKSKRKFDLNENCLTRISPPIKDIPPIIKMAIINFLHRDGIEKSFTSLM